jgi:hypothetical protein
MALLAVSALRGPAFGWGASGHSIVAEIAERHLEPAVRDAVRAQLGQKSMASVSSWADAIAALRPETRAWHYVNVPLSSQFDAARDCAPKPAGDCIVAAITRFRRALSSPETPDTDRREALLFLIHLVADIHQPMHASDNNDEGGNKRAVTFQGKPTNLHFVWDVSLIDARTFFWGEYADALMRDVVPNERGLLQDPGRAEEWANEAHALGLTVAYDLPADGIITHAYEQRAMAVIDRQLARSGLRLAAVLNAAFAPR